MIVRGRTKAVVGLRARVEPEPPVVDRPAATTPAVPLPVDAGAGLGADAAAASPRLALDYSGMNMKLIHLLLDKKRAKCMHAHNDSESEEVRQDVDWVLSAFPEMHAR
jgi:hypothetical protein